VIEILECVTVKILGVVNCDLQWDSVTIDNVLSEEFFYGSEGYVGDRLRLNPFREVFYHHNGEGVIALCWCEFVDYVNAPPLEGPRWGNQWQRLCWSLGAM
jgi:hypothetical protein